MCALLSGHLCPTQNRQPIHVQVCLGILEVVKLMIRVKTEELTRKRE